MKKVVVIGANGFTGRRIVQHLAKQGYLVYAFSLNPDRWITKGYHFVQVDLQDYIRINELLTEIRPKVVVNTAALSTPDYCQLYKEEAFAINVAAVENLANCCNQLKCRLIHLSTDFVFDGQKQSLYTEDDIPNPVNYYGKSKWLGEKVVVSACKNYAIARVVVVYGKPYPGQHGNIFQLVKNRLENSEIIRVVADQWRTPTWVQDVVEGVELLIDSSKTGIYHIAGGEILSIAEIAFRVANYFKLDSSLILPVTTLEMQEMTPRLRFGGLSIEKACSDLGYKPHTLEEGMEELR